MRRDGSQDEKKAKRYALDDKATIALLHVITDTVFGIQQNLKEQNESFKSTSILGLPEDPEAVVARNKDKHTIEHSTKMKLRKDVLKVLDNMLKHCKLGELVKGEGNEGPQFWEIKGLSNYKEDNIAIRENLINSLKIRQFAHLEGDAKQKAAEDAVKKIFRKAEIAMQKFQRLDAVINDTGDKLLKQAKKRASTEEEITMELVYGLALAVIGAVVATASLAVLVSTPLIFIPLGQFMMAYSGAVLGVSSAIGGVSLLLVALVEGIDKPYEEARLANWASDYVPKFYQQEITELMSCLDKFRKSLPTELQQITQESKAIGAAEYETEMDKSNADRIKQMQERNAKDTIGRSH